MQLGLLYLSLFSVLGTFTLQFSCSDIWNIDLVQKSKVKEYPGEVTLPLPHSHQLPAGSYFY